MGSFVENVNKMASLTPTNVEDLSLIVQNIDAINQVAPLADDLNDIIDNIIPNLDEILQADNSATTAKEQATIATTQAVIATTKAGEAEQFRNEAEAFSLSKAFVVDTIEALSTIPSSYTTAIVKDLNRGGTFIWSATGTANGGTVFAGVSGYWARQYEGLVNVKWFGAKCDGITDDSSAILSAISFSDTLEVPSDTYAPSADVFHTGNAVFVGEGKLLAYRKTVADVQHAADVLNSLDVTGKHLQTFRKAKKPVVVLIGDSTNTYMANSLGRGDMLAECIHHTLDKQSPDGITFYNRSIGGKMYSNLFDTQYASYIPWYAGKSTTIWINLVKELTPDLVIFGFGMNDSSTINPFYIKSAIDELQTWAKVPSIVLATPLVPSPLSLAYNEGRTGQEGRDIAAGLIRSYAKYRNVGLLDFNRKTNMVRDGFDILSTSFMQGDTIIPIGTDVLQRAEGTKECYDFKVSIKINPTNLSASKYFTIKIGSGASDFIQFFKPDANTIRVDAYYGRTGDSQETSNYGSYSSSYSYPASSSYALTVEKKGNYITVYREDDSQYGAFNEPIFFFKCVSFGGLFKPSVDCLITDDTFSEVKYTYSVPKSNLPSIKNNLLWGNEVPSMIDTYGGSGYNHPSGFMATHVYRPVIDSIEWHDGRTFTTTDNAVARYDGETGCLQDSKVKIFDNGRVSINGAASYSFLDINSDIPYGRTVGYTGTDAGAFADVFMFKGTTCGSIGLSSTGTTYSTSSDYRLKEDFKEPMNICETIKLLKPTDFKWKSNGERTIGFIAHELQQYVPSAVSGTKDATDEYGAPIYQAVDYSKLVPILTAAIKELIARVEVLENK